MVGLQVADYKMKQKDCRRREVSYKLKTTWRQKAIMWLSCQ